MKPQTLNPPFEAVFEEELEAIAAHYVLPVSQLQATAGPLLPWFAQYWEMVFAADSFELITAGNGREFAEKVVQLALELGLSEKTVAIFRECCRAFPAAILGIKLCFSANGAGLPTIYVRTKSDTETGLHFLSQHLTVPETAVLREALQHNQTLYGLGFSEKEDSLYVKTYTIEDVETPDGQKIPGFVSHRLHGGNRSREHKIYLPEVPLADFQPEEAALQELRDFLLFQMHYSQAGHIGLLYENGLPKEYKIYVERAGGIPTDFFSPMNARAYLLHTRPQTYGVTFYAAFTGYALSPAKPAGLLQTGFELLALLLVFSICLWGGTNAFNSGQDGNDGPLTLLPDPPPVPKFLSGFGLGLMLLAVVLAAFLNSGLAILTAIGVVLSVYYSWQNPVIRRGKDIPVVDMLINTVGFGLCSILFGFMLTGAPLNKTLFGTGIGFTFAYLGGMPTSQIFQLPEHKTKPKNYTSLFGVATILKTGSLFFLLHLAFLLYFDTDLLFLRNNLAALLCWSGWIGLVLAAAVHSFWWSREPFRNSYNRMNRQMILMMTSQVLWTVYAWLHTRS